jgi:CheY-like chemotaxis protein
MDKRLAGRRILVVEDEMVLVMFIEELLADSGCETVASAATVEQALALLDSQPPFDCAMLDLNLKGSLSYPVADAMAARAVPFLFVTGYGMHGIHDRYRDRPVLQKPFEYEELVGVLAGLAFTHPRGNATVPTA